MKQIRQLFAIALVVSFAACSKDTTAPGDGTNPPPPVTPATESDVFLAGARTAWTFVENNTQASTGLAKSHDTFQFVTTWDIASQIGAIYWPTSWGSSTTPTMTVESRKFWPL